MSKKQYIGITKQFNIVSEAKANVDAKYGTYDSIQEAIQSIVKESRALGLTVGIIENDVVKEYWWKTGTDDQDLILKIDKAAYTKISELENDSKYYTEDEVKYEVDKKADQSALDELSVEVSNKVDNSELPNISVGIKQYKEKVTNITDLPKTNNVVGDARVVVNDKGTNGISFIWLWDGSSWSRTAFTVFPSDVALKDDIVQLNNGLWAADVVKNGQGEKIFKSDYLNFVAYYTLIEQPITGQLYTIAWENLTLLGTTNLSVVFYLWDDGWASAYRIGSATSGDGSLSFTIPSDFDTTKTYRLGIHRGVNSGGSIRNVRMLKASMTSKDAQEKIILLESKIDTSKEIYVSSSLGNDNNEGDKNNPVKTIARAKELGAKKIYLRRNDIFYETVSLGDNILDAYGYGSLPTISGFRTLDAYTGLWEQESTNIWRLDLSSPIIGGYPFKEESQEMNICHIYDIKYDKIRGVKSELKTGLTKNYQFYQSDQDLSTIHILYMYLDFDPNTFPMKFASKVTATSCANSEMRNVRIEGADFGIFAHSNNIIENIEIDCIGGGFHGYTSGGYTRAGNGVQWYTLYGKSSNIFRNSRISRVYDTAFTIQGSNTGTLRDIIITNNVISNCGQAFEMWSKNDTATPRFIDCVFSNNLCINNGLGDNGFPKRDIHAFLLSYGMDEPASMLFENNVFFNGNFYYCSTRKYNDNKKYSFKRNTLYVRRGQYLIFSVLDNETVYIPDNADETADNAAIGRYRELADDYSTNIIIIDSDISILSEVLKLTKL